MKWTLCLLGSIAFAAALAAGGCRNKPAPTPGGEAVRTDVGQVGPSAVRLYMVSDLAGALEPCGCVLDQLGGLDHAAAYIAAERSHARATALVSAGPLFFLDPVLDDDRRGQDLVKAKTLALSLKAMGFVAFAPGRNDWAAGADTLRALAEQSGAAMVFANANQDAGVGPVRLAVRDLGGVKVGFVGVAAPDLARDAPPVPGLVSSPAIESVKAADVEVRAQGARVVVALAAVGRGEAKRIAEAVPGLTAVLVGTTGRMGNLNTPTPPVERVGDVLVVETGNHLQTLGVLDLVPAGGSFTARYTVREVREGLGQEPTVKDFLLAYYKRVNDDNKSSFAARKPARPAAGQPGYAGVAACAKCHAAAKAVWDKTPHARAYATLSRQHKEFNLDCVSCHVTGYARPGGSTVTHVDGLTDVQCEVCHGPGSKHVASPSLANIVVSPSLESCRACHFPPHVHSFDPAAKVSEILGPGHGRPM